ncbi:MAG: hypothetical protein [Microviridae sp.]|nr:MAG: hypothetical protein [Microviridae sp.]
MKQNEKQQSKSKVTEGTEQSQFSEGKQDKQNSPGATDEQPGEELIQRDEVENTPFQVITINKESFGVFGQYRITEMYHTKQQCMAELRRMDWNRIVQICTLINEMLNKNTKTTI